MSQDFNRFIWDGNLLLEGINPYLYTPDSLLFRPDVTVANANMLYEQMGSLSARNFSNYPPLNQLFFAAAALLGGKSIFGQILALRTFIILSDVGLLYFGRKLLKKLNLSPYLIFWYFLNPLIIMELTGNLHFEGVMLFFFVWAIYLISLRKYNAAAFPYAMSIAVKLVPILFLPVFIRYMGWKRSLLFFSIVGLVCLGFFFPFYTPEVIRNYLGTIRLWFDNFEFNAGFYNGLKIICTRLFDIKGWKLIRLYGMITPFIVILSVLVFSFRAKNKKLLSVIGSMLAICTLYFLISTTVHPWYLAFPVVLCIFTRFRFPLVWSGTILLSYYAYSVENFTENLWLLFLEYAVVYGFMGYELLRIFNKKLNFRKNWHFKFEKKI